MWFAAYADPPTPYSASLGEDAGELMITPPHGWGSSAQEKALHCDITYSADEDDKIPHSRIVDSAWDEDGGLIILGRLPSDSFVMDYDRYYRNTGEAFLSPPRVISTSICSAVDYFAIRKNRKITYCDKVIPIGFILQAQGGGCNPGGELVFPNAPKFNKEVMKTRLRHLPREQVKAFRGRCLLTPQKIAHYFPKYKFAANNMLEEMAKRMIL